MKEKKILDHVNFSVEPGDTIALVGATGSGKTTIINNDFRNYIVILHAIL